MVCLHSIFHCRLSKMCVLRTEVHNGRSRSSKVTDFGTNQNWSIRIQHILFCEEYLRILTFCFSCRPVRGPVKQKPIVCVYLVMNILVATKFFVLFKIMAALPTLLFILGLSPLTFDLYRLTR